MATQSIIALGLALLVAILVAATIRHVRPSRRLPARGRVPAPPLRGPAEPVPARLAHQSGPLDAGLAEPPGI